MRATQSAVIVLLNLCAMTGVASEPAVQRTAQGLEPEVKAAQAGVLSPTPQSISESSLQQQLMTGQAWAAFCDRMKALGQEILSDKYPGEPLDRAEGFRHLARSIILGLEWRLEHANAEFPMFMRHDDDVTQWGGPNVDNTYLRATIDGASTYRVDGDVTGLHDIIVSAKKADMHEGQFEVAELDLAQLKVDRNGHFELILSPQAHKGNWLQTKPGMTMVTIRAYYYDWAKDHPGDFHIVKIGNEGKAPPRITPAEVSRGLEQAAAFIEGDIRYWNDFIREQDKNSPGDNTFPPPRHVAGGSGDLFYGNGFFNLADDEALIVESQVPKVSYWGLQYYTLGWFEAPDYANRVTSLNGAQVRADGDGKVRWVVAHRDPGVPNWIDTEGRRRGLLAFRWMGAKEPPPQPTARLVKFSELKKYLPKDTPSFSEAQRRSQVMIRRRHIETRFHQ